MKIATFLILIGIMLFLIYMPTMWAYDTRIFCITIGAIAIIGAGMVLRYAMKRL